MNQFLGKRVGCIVFLFFCFFLYQNMQPVVAATLYDESVVRIQSIQNFYEEISNQIMNHETTVCYQMYSYDMYMDLKNVVNRYSYHYCDKKPQYSGMYLINYVDEFKYSYWIEKLEGREVYKMELNLGYKYDKKEMDSFFEEMQQVALRLARNSEYESIKAIHNYINDQVVYDKDYKNYLDIEGFRTGKMVCNGYSMAMFLLLSDINIPVRIIVGTAYDEKKNTVGHAWNIVKLNGAWYNIDATWDDSSGIGNEYSYFLKGDLDFANHFCDEECKEEYKAFISEFSYSMPLKDTLKQKVFQGMKFVFSTKFLIIFFGILAFIDKVRNRKISDA